jgi:hypothetical protein
MYLSKKLEIIKRRNKMKIFHVLQDVNHDYEVYFDFVCCAKNATIARNMNPATGKPMTKKDWSDPNQPWAFSLADVKVKYIGTAFKQKTGIICSSYFSG